MINIHIYGILKKKFNKNARMAENTIIKVPHKSNETFSELLNRLNVDKKELGDCFINGKLAFDHSDIPDESRVALFSFGMHLIDGGQHIKGHGYITKPPPKKINYY
ncbi:MAG: hypothetical protein ACXAC7_18415 [Candidatus Hodarchaeales archaeon]|jgi:hypothetical protein